MKIGDLKKKISVLGCGWLGLPLAQRLVKEGAKVKGSTTTDSKQDVLKEHGILPYAFSIAELNDSVSDFIDSDTLIVTIPPNRKEKEAFTRQLESIADLIRGSQIQQVIVTSSIGVYGTAKGSVKEEDADRNSFIHQIEQIFLNCKNKEVCILRLGGLMGANRNPGKFLAGRKGIAQPNGFINFVHLDDVVEVIVEIVKKKGIRGAYNLVAPEHPTKIDFYTTAANKINRETPEFNLKDKETGKIVSSEKLIQRINYTFIHSNPIEAL